MENKKQIEEMADDLYTCHDEYARDGDDWVTDYKSTAKNLYNKNYRKVSAIINEVIDFLHELKKIERLYAGEREALGIRYAIKKIKEKYKVGTENG